MNPDTLTETLQRGFRVTLGAASFFAETLQDSQKRDENLSKLRMENFSVLSDEWAVEGARKEEEARTFVESVVNQSPTGGPNMPTPPATSNPPASGADVVQVPSDIAMELGVLKTQLAEIRTELEKANRDDEIG